MIEKYMHASDLPEDWDTIVGDNIYMTRKFLCFIEQTDHCSQRYFLIRSQGGEIDTIFMTYIRRRYNLAMFTKYPMFVKMTFIYLPMSVTRPGIIFNNLAGEALEYIKSIKGYKIILNLGESALADCTGFAKGLTCPKCILRIRWNSFEEYMQNLRSNYRHRYKKALRMSGALRFRFLSDGSAFTDEMYGLYLQVYNHSSLRIEKLSKKFFEGAFFRIFVMEDMEGPQGFVQLIENGDELIFEFVGFNYAANQTYDTYMRMLLEIVRYGIENGFKTIDFGQTADDTKLKIGCTYTYLYAYLHHSNRLMNSICRRLAPHLEYRPLTTPFQVFKENK